MRSHFARPCGHQMTALTTVVKIDRPVQMIDRRDVVITQLSDEELLLIASGGRIEDGLEIKVIPPMQSKD